jgi:hypothetical protein
MEVYYRADNTNGVIWHLRARSVANGGSATYPWEFVGGGALTKFVASGGSTTISGWTSAATTNCDVVLPAVAGDFHVSAVASSVVANAGLYQVGVAVGTSGTPTIRGVRTIAAGAWQDMPCVGPLNVSSASQTLRVRFNNSAGGTIDPEMSLVVTPIRVG